MWIILNMLCHNMLRIQLMTTELGNTTRKNGMDTTVESTAMRAEFSNSEHRYTHRLYKRCLHPRCKSLPIPRFEPPTIPSDGARRGASLPLRYECHFFLSCRSLRERGNEQPTPTRLPTCERRWRQNRIHRLAHAGRHAHACRGHVV